MPETTEPTEPIESPATEDAANEADQSDDEDERSLLADDAEPQERPYDGDGVRQENGL